MHEKLLQQRTEEETAARESLAFALDLMGGCPYPGYSKYYLRDFTIGALTAKLWGYLESELGADYAHSLLDTAEPCYWTQAFVRGDYLPQALDRLRDDNADEDHYFGVSTAGVAQGAFEVPSHLAKTYITRPEWRNHLANSLFIHQSALGNWENVDSIDWAEIDYKPYLEAASNAAEKGIMTRAEDYLSRSIAAYDNSEKNELDTFGLRKGVDNFISAATRFAFCKGDIQTLLDLPGKIPESQLLDYDHIRAQQLREEARVIHESGKYERGVNLLAAHVIEDGADNREAYELVARKLPQRQWSEIAAIASELDTTTVKVLACLALKEGDPCYRQLLDLAANRPDSDKHYPAKGDETSSSMLVVLAAARGQNWPLVMSELQRGDYTFYGLKGADIMIDAAIDQDNTAALLEICKHSMDQGAYFIAEEVLNKLEAQGMTQSADDLLRTLGKVPDYEDIVDNNFRRTDVVRISAKNGNWLRAAEVINKIGSDIETRLQQNQGTNGGHITPMMVREFDSPQFLAIEALRTIAAVERSKALQAARKIDRI